MFDINYYKILSFLKIEKVVRNPWVSWWSKEDLYAGNRTGIGPWKQSAPRDRQGKGYSGLSEQNLTGKKTGQGRECLTTSVF